MYCRISKTSSNSSSYRQTVPTLIFAVLYGVSVYLLFQFVPEKHMDNAFSFYVVFPLSIFSASNYYNNFIDSIRSFNDGIKLPGRNATLIPWKKIGMLHLNCNTITVQNNDKKNTWQLDNRDVDEMKDIIKVWENNTSNILRN